MSPDQGTSAYGLWSVVLLDSLVFIFFAFSFFQPKSRRDWRTLGSFSAFIVALFAEMYGFPLTVYLMSGWLQSRYPGLDVFSHDAGHIWYTLLGLRGDPHSNPIHIASYAFIVGGFLLLWASWRVLYAAQRSGTLARSGPYRYVRHPQYVAFLAIMFGFLLQWPTLPTLVMFPILAVVYVRLAHREEREVATEFRESWYPYAACTPRWFPRFGPGGPADGHASEDAPRPHTSEMRLGRLIVLVAPVLLLLLAESATGVAVPFWFYLPAVLAGLLMSRSMGRPQVLVHENEAGPFVLIPNARLDHSLGSSVPRQRPWLSLVLLAATLVTTTFTGADLQGVSLLHEPRAWTLGLPYALAVLAILGVHEMGHYLAARLHGIRVSLPYFVPVPFGLGTFGAFIRLPALLPSRRQLFDIGVAGPLAGLAVALPALALGLRWSLVLPAYGGGSIPMGQGVSINSSLLLALISKLALGTRVAEGHYVLLHPLAFAGWLGVMLTALNLLPVGQLDGGHVAQALFGRTQANRLGKITLFGIVALGLLVRPGLLSWALIVFLVAGSSGLPPADAVTPLDRGRTRIGWLAFAVLALILLPLPHALSSSLGLHCEYL